MPLAWLVELKFSDYVPGGFCTRWPLTWHCILASGGFFLDSALVCLCCLRLGTFAGNRPSWGTPARWSALRVSQVVPRQCFCCCLPNLFPPVLLMAVTLGWVFSMACRDRTCHVPGGFCTGCRCFLVSGGPPWGTLLIGDVC